MDIDSERPRGRRGFAARSRSLAKLRFSLGTLAPPFLAISRRPSRRSRPLGDIRITIRETRRSRSSEPARLSDGDPNIA